MQTQTESTSMPVTSRSICSTTSEQQAGKRKKKRNRSWVWTKPAFVCVWRNISKKKKKKEEESRRGCLFGSCVSIGWLVVGGRGSVHPLRWSSLLEHRPSSSPDHQSRPKLSHISLTVVISVPGRLCVTRSRSSSFLFLQNVKGSDEQFCTVSWVDLYLTSISKWKFKTQQFFWVLNRRTRLRRTCSGSGFYSRLCMCLKRAASSSTVEFSQFHTFLREAQRNVSRGHFISAQTQSMDVLMTDSRRAVCLSWTVAACQNKQTKNVSVFTRNRQ